MPKLIPTDEPKRTKNPPKYMAYVDVLNEFAKLDEEFARIEVTEGDEDVKYFPGRLRAAIQYLGGPEKAGCRVRSIDGVLYLQKVGDENE